MLEFEEYLKEGRQKASRHWSHDVVLTGCIPSKADIAKNIDSDISGDNIDGDQTPKKQHIMMTDQ